MATFTYSADQHFLTIGGFPIQGFQEGSTLSIAFDEDQMSKQVDVDGKNVTFIKSNNHTTTVSFTLNEGSPANDFLSQLYADFRAGNGGVEPMFFKDNNGRSLAQSDACTVQTVPGLGGGAESSGREWTLSCGQTQMFVGGADAAI
ncbi:MAG: hypothetical protein KJP02_07940 [Octadecabacter sp.]|nr:hypothetical protein [Octadecabacter sp.]